MAPLSIGNLLLGTAMQPGMSAIASAYAESAASSNIPWSALEYSGQTITGISGSGIGAQADPSQFIPASASSGFQPSGDYAYNSAVSGKADQSALDDCCSSMSSVVSSIETSITAISSTVSGLTGTYIEQSASGMFAPSGDYAYNSAVSGKLDKSSQVVTSTAGGSGMVSAINGSAILDRDTHDGLTALSAEVATAIAIPMKPLVEGSGIDLNEGPDSVTISVSGMQPSGNYLSASQSSWFLPMSGLQSAYASASGTQATAQNVLYILIPDGE